MSGLEKWGGAAALYLAAAYAAGLVLFLVVLDYPHLTSAAEKVALIGDRPGLFFASNLILYVIFGFCLIVLVTALYERVRAGAPETTRIAAIVGVIWAGSLIASGMVSNAGIGLVTGLFATDPAQAALTWTQVDAVASGLGNGDGEILGGVMTLLFSWAGLRGNGLPRLLNYLGAVVGVIGIASILPGLTDLTGIFGLTQLVWFAWIAVVLLRRPLAAAI